MGNVAETTGEATKFLKCDCCDAMTASERWEWDTFAHGPGPNRVELKVLVPVIYCSSCDLAFTDHRAEELRENAAREPWITIKFPT